MGKRFEEWNKRKIETNNNQTIKSFQEREIWFIKIGENIGFEQDGSGKDFLRPVIIYKKFSKHVFLGIPLTKSKKKENKFYSSFTFHKETSTAILSQIRLFDTKRLQYLLGKMSQGDFAKVKEKLTKLLQ